MFLNTIRRLRENLSYRYHTSSSERFVSLLRSKGVRVGEDCIFYTPRSIMVDLTRPCLISFGNGVRVTQGVIILTHGADWHVLRELYKRPFGSAGKVVIKDNVFIGMRAIILKGVTVNENSIIGAGSVVTNDIPANTVAAGVPARPIMGIHEYYRKREELQMAEAVEYAQAICERYDRLPVPTDFTEFFHLFAERSPDGIKSFPIRRQVGKYYDEFMRMEPKFSSFKEFLDACGLSGVHEDKCDFTH